MRIQDKVFAAVCAWKENREAGIPGLTSVINVLQNRANRDRTDIYSEAVKRLQFSSLTAPGDPELVLWAADGDAQWQQALVLAKRAGNGALDDITGGAMDYYAPKGQTWTKRYTLPDGTVIPFPDSWDESKVVYTVTIGGQYFFREI